MARRATAVSQLRGAWCLAGCHFDRRAQLHHDRLLRVDRDQAGMLDLLELALTWDELDYEMRSLIEPSEWGEFLDTHRWHDYTQAERVFSLAADIVRRGRPAGVPECVAEPVMSVFSALTGQSATTL